jgi:hypothetical protein
MSMHVATAGRLCVSTNKVFCNCNFHTGKRLSTLIVAKERRTFQLVTANWGRPLSVQTPNLEEDILHHIEQNPVSSTRRIATVEHVTHDRVESPTR